jgi:hypothetical protein
VFKVERLAEVVSECSLRSGVDQQLLEQLNRAASPGCLLCPALQVQSSVALSRRPCEIAPHGTALSDTEFEPLEKGISGLHPLDVSIVDWQRLRFEFGIKEEVVAFIGDTISPKVGERDDCPRPHRSDAPGPASALKKL